MNDYIKLILCLLISFLFSFVFCKVHLKMFNSKPKDQIEVKDIKPNHVFKSMGGIDFLLSTLIVFIIFNIKNTNQTFYVLLFTIIYYGLIGLIDDLIKVLYQDNKGLSGFIRIIFEIFGVLIIINFTSLNLLEFIKLTPNRYIYIGGFAIIYAIICVLGCCNGVNLTDGLDGLVTITYILAVTPFLYLSLLQQNFVISSFIMCLLGSMLAYLCFNFNPSKLIMGDVGSIPLGALIAIIAMLLNYELLILVSGLIYIIEALSVILQVSFFKISKGKRIFKMAPLHYHFIKLGMKESNVVLLFTIFSIIFSILATIIGVIL